MATSLTLRSLYLDLTRNAEGSNSFLTVDPIPPITSAMIQNFTIVNEDISASADISGSKIANASIPLDKIENVGSQTFAEYLADLGLPNSGSVTSDMIVDGTILTNDISDGQITSDKIANFTIVDEDISASANIAGSKIVAASETDAGVVNTTSQTFNGLKVFKQGAAFGGLVHREGLESLDNALTPIIRLRNTDESHSCGSFEYFVKNTHTSANCNMIVILIQMAGINTGQSYEVSSFFEITLIGHQPISTVSPAPSTVVSATPAQTVTTRCLLTVTGIEVTTTLLGKSSTEEPLVSTALKRMPYDNENTINLVIAVGFKRFSAYHLRGFRAGEEPVVHFVSRPGATVLDQAGADTILNSLLVSYT